jgi:RNA polymerase sigma factor (sigma-70 family)
MDAELVSRALAGDRESFNEIVVRYQTLVCSLAYNGLGNLGQSEDVAQEAFVTAWKHLGQLREPAKLRAWLCGIVRNLVHKNRERDGREPSRNAETLESAQDSATTQTMPSEEAINREEQAILWRSLQNIPPLYREPLILFYREQQSVESTAEKLGLSADAVKQRLSRGRGLLRQEVEVFVEKTLRRTAPGQGFAGMVLAALPGAPTSGTIIGVAGKSATAAKGFLGTWLAPLLGILAGIAAHWLIVRAAPTPQERRLKRAGFVALWIFVLGWCLPGQLAMRALSSYLKWDFHTYFIVMTGFWFFYALVVTTLSVLMFRLISAVRSENENETRLPGIVGQPMNRFKRIVVLAGVHLACFWWVLLLAVQARDRIGGVVTTVVMLALALRNAYYRPGQTGVEAARAVAAHLALIWGAILTILSFRLVGWEAHLHGLTLTEMRSLLPLGSVPLLSLALAGWVVLLLKLTKPKPVYVIGSDEKVAPS